MSLSSLIVKREVASIREIEEALARQVLYGGDFVTNLLEVSRIEEGALMPVVAESFGLPVAPIGELPKVPSNAARLVTADVVAAGAFAPLAVGTTLVVAVAEPLSLDAEQQLTFALALPIEQQIAPLFRIRQALARDYGLPLDKRTSRLITKVVHKGPRIASTFPPPLDSAPALRVPPRPPTVAPPPPVPEPAEHLRTPPAPQGTFVRTGNVPSMRPARRRRGPLTSDVALSELEASAERDAIFDLLFDFAKQFFDYTALFVAHGEVAEGRDAFGDGASREKVARMGVPLELPSILSMSRARKEVVRVQPSSEGIDPVLMADLGRHGRTDCIVFPIIVRKRVVALLFGDGGSSGIDDGGVRQVELLVEASSGAFERVIMRRKLKAGDALAEGGAAAAKKKAADSEPAPSTKVSGTRDPRDTFVRDDSPSEELAPPLRELLADPPPRVGRATQEPSMPPMTAPPMAVRPSTSGLAAAFSTSARPSTSGMAQASLGGSASRFTVDTSTLRGDLPPPPNVLRVSRPSGRPIPREEPESKAERPASGGAPRSKSQGLKRAAAPAFEFGTPSVPSVITESAFGSSLADRHVITQIHGSPHHSEAPVTMRDPEGMAGRGSRPPEPMGFRDSLQHLSPPSLDLRPRPIDNKVTIRAEDTPDPTPSPKLNATLVSGARVLPAVAPKEEVKPEPIRPIVVLSQDDVTPVSTSFGASTLTDADPTPIAPAVFDPDDQPTPLSGVAEPVLALAHRKGAPPPLMPEPKLMPASEHQVSVPPHRPPSSHGKTANPLPSVIVDVASEYDALVERVLEGPDEDAESALLRAGAEAMPAIMARFPGPTSIERKGIDGPLPRVGECGPVIRLIASQRRTALPFVLKHIESRVVDARFWATYLLTELVYPDAIDAAISRIFDEDASVRLAARAATRALAAAHPQPVVERLGDVASMQAPMRRVFAIESLGETREPLAVPVLLPLLEDDDDAVVSAARTALVLITQQDFGGETDRWLSWWSENRGRHRLEWLIDSLMHEQRAIRGSASDELRTITKEYFAYYDDLPKRERERAQARYRDWWENIGRVRFSRASTRGS